MSKMEANGLINSSKTEFLLLGSLKIKVLNQKLCTVNKPDLLIKLSLSVRSAPLLDAFRSQLKTYQVHL